MKRLLSHAIDEIRDIGVGNILTVLAVIFILLSETFGRIFLLLSWKAWLVIAPVLFLMLFLYREEVCLFVANLSPRSLNLLIFCWLLLFFALKIQDYSYYAHVRYFGRGAGGLLLFEACKFPLFLGWMFAYGNPWRFLMWPLLIGSVVLYRTRRKLSGSLVVALQLLVAVILNRDPSMIAGFGAWMNDLFGLHEA